MRSAILFDDGKGELSPLTDLRGAFDIRTGALTTLDRLSRAVNVAALFVPPALEALTRERHELPVNLVPDKLNRVLIINARCPIPPDGLLTMQVGEAIIEKESGDLVAAALDAPHAAAFLSQLPTSSASPFPFASAREAAERQLLSRPWDVRRFRDRALDHDLALLTDAVAASTNLPGVTVFGDHRLCIDATAKVYPTVVFDLEQGPVFVDKDAAIRPGAIVCGPAYIGQRATVLDRAVIRPHTSIGPRCKAAGEIGGTIFQGCSNKAHDGYLGDSYVGEWCNLGAGTTNSNLLNTYGEIISVAKPGGSYERTGETFLGAIIGDHVKTAICTRIMTGAVLHTGSMFAQTAAVAGCVGRFTWATDAGQRTFRLEKFLDVMRAAMARRKVTPSAAYLARVADLHRETAAPSAKA